MKYKHQYISPAEIEHILLSHPGIQEAIVVGVPHGTDGDWPAAVCKKAPESKVTADELMSLTSNLEDYKKLRGGIHFVNNYPTLPSGKIARNQVMLFAKRLVKKDSRS